MLNKNRNAPGKEETKSSRGVWNSRILYLNHGGR
jgi:hypothetical protein